VGISGAVYSAGEARHDGKVTFGSGNAYLNSSAGDNFTLSTKTNTPNPNFNINIGDGTASGYSKNPIFWNGFLAFSGNGKADTGTPDVKIDGSGNLAIGVASPLRKLHLNGGEFCITPSGTTAFLNLSDVSGNSGASYNLNIRGLDTSGSVGATLASITLGASAIYTPGVIYNNSSRPILKQSGSIMQVVQTTKTSTSSAAISANTYGEFDSAFRVSITPSTTSSKILISAYITGAQNTGTVRYKFQYSTDGGGSFNNVTPIGDANASHDVAHFGYAVNGDTNQFNTCGMELLHSPATTNAIIYRILFGADVGTTYQFNRSINYPNNFLGATCTSTFIAKEISG
jgi:hypothetical protein